MKCIILAGGFATRLWPLSENKAKPLLHLKDRPILSHIVDGIPAAMPIVVSTNSSFRRDFEEWAKNYPDRSITIFADDSEANESKKGALGAAALTLQRLGIDEDLFLVAGDNYFGFSIPDFLAAFRGNPLLAAYDIGDLALAKRFGVVVAQDGLVVGFQEKPTEPKSTLVSTGCYVFPRKNLGDLVAFAQKRKDDLGGIFTHLLQKGETIETFSFEGAWYDIGSFEGYLKANRELLGDRVIEQGSVATLGGNVFKGGVFLGDRTTVENSILENSVIQRDCVIKNCVLRNCIVDEGSRLSGIDLSRQMVRRGSVIEKK